MRLDDGPDHGMQGIQTKKQTLHTINRRVPLCGHPHLHILTSLLRATHCSSRAPEWAPTFWPSRGVQQELQLAIVQAIHRKHGCAGCCCGEQAVMVISSQIKFQPHLSRGHGARRDGWEARLTIIGPAKRGASPGYQVTINNSLSCIEAL